jgi:hypothetical protein
MAHKQTIKLDDIPKIPKLSAAKAAKATDRALSDIGKQLVRAAVAMTKSRNAVATGLYMKSFEFTTTKKTVTLINTAPYAYFVERGRGPGKAPPRAAIVAWLKRKFPGQFGAKNWNYTKRAAHVIAKKIGQRGTNPSSRYAIIATVTKSADVEAVLTSYLKAAR